MQQVEEIAPHVQEIARALDNRVEIEQIEDELRRYLEYGVPLAKAKREIVRNHGGTLKGGRKKIGAFVEGDAGVEFVAKVLTVNPKEIMLKGEPKEIYYGFLADETGKVPYTAWKDFQLERGSTVEVANAYVKAGFREGVEVNLGDYTQIREAAEPLEDVVDTVSPAGEGGRFSPEKEIKELTDGLGSVTVTVRVLDVREKTINTQNGERTLIEGEVADATGKVPFTCWAPEVHGEALQKDAVVRVRNAYVKTWRGVPNLNFGENAKVEPAEAEALPPAEELAKPKPYTMGEIVTAGGGSGVLVEGVVLEVKKGSGLVMRCPECNRVLQKRECRVHGKVEGTPDLRVKAVLDDGTGALTFFLGKDPTEALLGKTIAECQEMAKEAMSTDVILDELAAKLTARRLEVTGNAVSDDFGVQLIGHDARFSPPADLEKEAEKVMNQLVEMFPEVA